jgi:hypothetical protein
VAGDLRGLAEAGEQGFPALLGHQGEPPYRCVRRDHSPGDPLRPAWAEGHQEGDDGHQGQQDHNAMDHQRMERQAADGVEHVPTVAEGVAS